VKVLGILMFVAFLVISLVGGPLRSHFAWTDLERWALWAAQSMCLVISFLSIHLHRRAASKVGGR
jgi:hypothetical protein